MSFSQGIPPLTKERDFGQICKKNNCHHCCVETEMLLTKKDIKRIEQVTSVTPTEFAKRNENGFLMLRNKQISKGSQCFFLDNNGLCSIYEIRPIGCKFYPIIWDFEQHRAILDDYCPHHDNFALNLSSVSEDLEDFIFKLFGKL